MLKQEISPESIARLNANLEKLIASHSLPRAFVKGILAGFGSIVGATVVVAIAAYFMRNIDVIPIVGSWLSEIFKHVIDNLPQN